mmetsp:Transcript_3812/g.15394  ORF Transcript_3812/g.15394 Transcript_3812/m.15394 type:complete len:223 (+) Transcript_3812:129-797(+)
MSPTPPASAPAAASAPASPPGTSSLSSSASRSTMGYSRSSSRPCVSSSNAISISCCSASSPPHAPAPAPCSSSSSWPSPSLSESPSITSCAAGIRSTVRPMPPASSSSSSLSSLANSASWNSWPGSPLPYIPIGIMPSSGIGTGSPPQACAKLKALPALKAVLSSESAAECSDFQPPAWTRNISRMAAAQAAEGGPASSGGGTLPSRASTHASVLAARALRL